MMRSFDVAGSALLALALAFDSPLAAAEPRGSGEAQPAVAPAETGAPIRLDDDGLDCITAAHNWIMVVDLTTTPPTVAKALVIHGGSVSSPPHTSFLVVNWPPVCTPCTFNTSGALDPLHWIDP